MAPYETRLPTGATPSELPCGHVAEHTDFECPRCVELAIGAGYERGDNVDCMSLAELVALADHVSAHADVKHYAALKARAYRLRLEGRIEQATRLEARAERIYVNLPTEEKW